MFPRRGAAGNATYQPAAIESGLTGSIEGLGHAILNRYSEVFSVRR